MYCSECGTRNQDEARFCRSCGRPLSDRPIPSNEPVRLASRAADTPLPAPRAPKGSPAGTSWVFTVAGYFWILWGVAIIAVGNNAPFVATLAAAVFSMVYGVALIRRHQSAVWFGWLVVVVFGVATLASGLVPLFILFWLLVTGFATYCHRQLPNERHFVVERRA
jgi:hypothetical protein